MPEPVAAQLIVTFLKPEMLHIYRQVTALREFRPVVLCQKREQAERFPFPEKDLVCVPKPRLHQLRRLWQRSVLGQPITMWPSEVRRARAALEASGAQVVHIYFGHIGVYALPLIERLDLPVVVSFHGADAGVDMEKPAYRAALARVFDRADLLLVRSESLAAALRALGASGGKIRLHRTGVPLSEIRARPWHPASDGAWHCVQACRLIAKKGLTTSLRAFATLAREFPHSRLTLAGEGPLREELESTARSLGIADRLTFAGFLSQEKLRALYHDAHFFLHPSETGQDGDQEGVPNSMLEAMAAGLPVLATCHGGIPEAIVDGESGLLFAERDADALGAGLLALARDPARAAALARAGAARVLAEFDLDRQARVLESLYREAAASRRAK